MEGDMTWGDEHTIQYTVDVPQNYTPETYITLLTNVTPINSIKKEKLQNKKKRQTMPDLNLCAAFSDKGIVLNPPEDDCENSLD